MREARYYTKESNKKVKCLLCPHYCMIAPQSSGICRNRTNIDGVLYARNYGKTVSISMDPIEKKPLYHYYPGTDILSIGPNSCNMRCDFCQNYSISQMDCNTNDLSPENLLEICVRHRVPYVAYTYTEPMTWFEYVLEASQLLLKNDIRSVLVTNGFINPDPLAELLPCVDAMNIDLKGMSEDFYHNICSGKLQPVLDTIKAAYQECHIEITNLLIPGENDTPEMIANLIDFLAGISTDIPLHFSRYFPQYKRHNQPTPTKSLETALKKAKEKLNYVYLGNVLTTDEGNTYCPNCNSLLVERKNYNTVIHNLQGNNCSVCSSFIYGKFN